MSYRQWRSVLVMKVGFLHPGAMGSAMAQLLDAATYWASEGRSDATAHRAHEAALTDAVTLDQLAASCDVVVSVCPPHAAMEVAHAVKAAGFDGVYLDANAIAPATARDISAQFENFVDGGVVGPPPYEPSTTRLYVSGQEARVIADLWEGTSLEVRLIDDRPGSASAVKAAFASWTKGSAALLVAIRAFAEAEGVTDDIMGEWATSIPDLVDRSSRIGMLTRKAWRFAGELDGLADAFEARGLPDGWQRAAAELYRRIENVESGEIDDVIAAALHRGSDWA